jgi:hypothetical protein
MMRFGPDADAPTPDTPREGVDAPDQPEIEAPLARELARMPEIEEKYSAHLEIALAPTVERNIAVYREALAASFDGAPSEALRNAWAQHRVDEPQPEDVKLNDKLQLDYALARNVAYARELEVRLVAEGKPGLGQEIRNSNASGPPVERNTDGRDPPPPVQLHERLPRDLTDLEPAIAERISELRSELKTVSAVEAALVQAREDGDRHLQGNRARGSINLHIEHAALARLMDEMERAVPAPRHLEVVRTPAPQEPALRPEPLMLERLRELRSDPKVAPLVEKDKAWLRAQVELATPDARARALDRAQEDMRAAATNGDKGLERKLRIRVMALDEFAAERPAQERPLQPRGLPAKDGDVGALVVPDPDELKPALEARLLARDPTPPPRPLPMPSVEATDPAHSLSRVAKQFVVQDTEPPTSPQQPVMSVSSIEGAAIHRRSALGLPEAPSMEDPTLREAPAVHDESTLPMPSPRELPSTPSTPEGPPIHRLGDLLEPTMEPGRLVLEPSLPGEARKSAGDPVFAPSAPGDEPTGGGVARPSGVPAPSAPEGTQEVRLDDLLDEIRPELDTQGRFDAHFDLMIEDRGLRGELRHDRRELDRMEVRADDGDLDAKATLADVAQRTSAFRTREANATPEELLRQYRTLVDDEQQPERTGGIHLTDRLALAHLEHQAARRHQELVATVAGELMTELKSTPWELDQHREEAIVLMSARERAFDEYPYSDKAFLSSELLRSYETNPEYAKVCALMLDAQKSVLTEYLLYEIEQDPAAYKAAQDRATSLVQLPPAETDDAIMRQLATARLDYVLARDPVAAEQALARAREAALIFDVLPMRRSLEVDTKPPLSRSPNA